MPTKNINAIGRASSGQLCKVLNASLADQVIKEMSTNGEYQSWDDLKDRNHGLGPARVRKLKENGFTIKATSKAGSNDDTTIGLSQTLRLNVSSMATQTWRYRDDRDLYTNLRKKEVVKCYPEVDHVWEIQLLNEAHREASEGQRITRGITTSLKNMVNGTTNLNITTRNVNQKKKGPFTTWLKDQSTELDDIVRSSDAGKYLVDEGHWSRITNSIVKTYNDMVKETNNIRDDAAKRHTERVLNSLSDMMDKMDI